MSHPPAAGPVTGPVTSHVAEHLTRQLQEHGVVVWYDPEGAFQPVFDALDGPERGLTKLALHGSYFALRAAAEPVTRTLRGGQAGGARLLVYVPNEPLPPLEDVLYPIECLGVRVRLTLAEAARQALAGVVPDKALREWLALPGVTLALLDARAGSESRIGALTAVFGDVLPMELAFQFLRDGAHAKAVAKHKLEPALTGVLAQTFGAALAAGDAASMRGQFARRVLLTEFLADLAAIPPELQALALPAPAQVEACYRLAERLRGDRQLEDAYRAWAAEAQQEFALDGPQYDAERVGRRDTFAFEERLALGHVAALARAGRWDDARAWIDDRARSFWAQVEPERRGQWDAARLAVQTRVAADQLLASLPGRAQPPAWWVARYVGAAGASKSLPNGAPNDTEPACEVDTLLRRLNVRAAGAVDQAGLEELVTLARERAAEAEQQLAERFVDAVRAAGGFGELPVQGDVFDREVRPLLEAGRKVVFVLADALRYEMARDLEEALGRGGVVRLGYAMATPPTVTKVGMAALVPGAEGGLALVRTAKGADAAVGGTVLHGLAERLTRYRARYGDRVADLTLEECLSAKKAALQKRVQAADLLLLRVQDLDEIGELDNLLHARALMTGLVPNIQLAIQRLAAAGAHEVVVAADHGYLLRDDVTDAMKLDLPTGEVLEQHRRCVVGEHLGVGGRPDVVVFRAAEFGLGGGLDLAFPRGINVFRTAGNMAYFHGGLSLQEAVVPVLRYTPAAVATAAGPKVTLEPKVAAVKTLVFQVVVAYGSGTQMELGGAPRRFRVAAAKDGRVVGDAANATLGFDEGTGEVQLLPGQTSGVFLQLHDAVSGQGELEVQLTDMASGETLIRKKLKYDLAF